MVACESTDSPPEAVVMAFLTHLSRSEGKQAHQLLCPRDQSLLASLSSRQGIDPVSSLKSLKPRPGAAFQALPQSRGKGTAVVDVMVTGGMRFPISLSQTKASWCLHLPQLKP
jgi:hypothetical protein